MIIFQSSWRDSNQELAFERKADIEQEDIDLIVQNLRKE